MVNFCFRKNTKLKTIPFKKLMQLAPIYYLLEYTM